MRRPPAPSPAATLGRTLAVVGLTLLLLAGLTTVARAAAVAPEYLAGNVSCKDQGYDFGFKIDDTPENAAYELPGDGDDSVTITNAGPVSFDWTSTQAFDAVIVKAGNKVALYEYDDPTASDTGMGSVPKDLDEPRGPKHQISHVEFCWNAGGEEEPPEEITVTKLWFDETGEPVEMPEPVPALVVEVTFDDEAETVVTLTEDELAPSEDVNVPEGASTDATVEETEPPAGWHEISCPTTSVPTTDEVVRVAAPQTEYRVCNQRDDDVTVLKLWFEEDGDERAAPDDSDIEVTVDIDDGDDIVLLHDDLDDGVVTLEAEAGNVNGVDETTVPEGWEEITCPARSAVRADHVLCNQEEDEPSGGGGGGGGRNPTTTTTSGIAEVLPFTAEEPATEPEPEAEVAAEAETTVASAEVLPFTGTSNGARLAAVATALLSLGVVLLLAGRRPAED